MLLKSFNLPYSSGELEQYRWNNTIVIDFARARARARASERASERACGRGFTSVRAMKLLPLSLLRPPSTIMRPSLLRSRCYLILQRAALRVSNRLSLTPASCDLMDEDRSERTPGRSLSENHRYAADRENKWLKGRRSPTRSILSPVR